VSLGQRLPRKIACSADDPGDGHTETTMHPRVESLPAPRPDHRSFLAAVRRSNSGPVPLVELSVDPEVIAALAETASPPDRGDRTARCAFAQTTVRLLHRLGYDAVKVAASTPFDVEKLHAADTAGLSRGDRAWQDPHRGPIQSVEDFERFSWPGPGDLDLSPVEAAIEVLPEGMALIGFCGGVFELATELMGLERFLYAVYDAPQLVANVIANVGRTVLDVFAAYSEMEAICALWLGDDLGSKNGLLVSPSFLKEHVFPWYVKFVGLAHQHGRPFLLHSCGNIAAVMPDLVDDIGIDAKHSFEDAILPVEHFVDTWGDKVAALGGIDVDVLARGSEEAVVSRTHQVLEHVAPSGGYACGSGNSITNYVPPASYLAMIEAVAAFNGRR
jgi:uroporphyrinogen decarboxylase